MVIDIATLVVYWR